MFVSKTILSALVAVFAVGALGAGPAAASDVTSTFSSHTAGSKQTVDHAAWDRLLGKYVSKGDDGVNRVDYTAWKAADHGPLKNYIKSLETIDPGKLDRPEQFAFWANLYNAKTIDVVLDHYPIGSIREITIDEGLFGFLKKSVGAGGPWKAKIINVAGRALSLDDIEHNILRPVFKDPRVHYAVNCASYGCPNLGTQAFTAAKLDAQLDAGARAYVNHPRGIAVDGSGLRASSIYEWFQADFGGTEAGVLKHVRKFAGDKLKSKLKGRSSIDGYAYDWTLNDIRRGS